MVKLGDPDEDRHRRILVLHFQVKVGQLLQGDRVPRVVLDELLDLSDGLGDLVGPDELVDVGLGLDPV